MSRSAAECRDHRRRHVRALHGGQARRTRASTPSRSSRRPTRSAAPGATTPTRGLTCDVPSRFYSYSFRPNPDWSHCCSPGPEIQRYFRQVADRARHSSAHPVRHRGDVRANTAMASGGSRTADGEEAFDVLVTATGVLRDPALPRHPRARHFAGTVVPLGALGPLGLVAGQADRVDRDGLHRRPDHRRARRKRARARRSSSARRSGSSRCPTRGTRGSPRRCCAASRR